MLRNKFLKNGFKTKKGKGLKTAVIDYIYYKLVINKNILDLRRKGTLVIN